MDYKDFKIDGNMVMDYCGESKDVVIPNGVTDIFFQAFCESKDIESVSIPGSVKEVPPFVFAMFDCLQKVIINEVVKKICSCAFDCCENLQVVYLPKSLKTLEEFSFSNCKLLKEVHFSGSNLEWEKIDKQQNWNKNSGDFTIIFNDKK